VAGRTPESEALLWSIQNFLADHDTGGERIGQAMDDGVGQPFMRPSVALTTYPCGAASTFLRTAATPAAPAVCKERRRLCFKSIDAYGRETRHHHERKNSPRSRKIQVGNLSGKCTGDLKMVGSWRLEPQPPPCQFRDPRGAVWQDEAANCGKG